MSEPAPPAFSDSEVEPDLYIEDFAEMVRDLIRAVAANDSSGAISHASGRIRRLFTHANRLPPELSWYKIIEGAVISLKPPYRDGSNYKHDYDGLAALGAKLLAELTTSDGLSTARIDKARRAIEDEVKFIPSKREYRRTGLID